jgi:hypothetical protein
MNLTKRKIWLNNFEKKLTPMINVNNNIIRHKILGVLYEKMVSNPESDEVSLTLKEICNLLKEYDEKAIYLNLDFLANDNQRDIHIFIENNIRYYLIDENGRDNYINNKYLKDYAKEEFEREKDTYFLEKLKVDYKISKWTSKTYWWTFGFAILSLLISLWLLFNHEPK